MLNKYYTILIYAYLLLGIGCQSDKVDFTEGVALILDNAINDGVSKFRFQKDHWDKNTWEIGLVEPFVSAEQLREILPLSARYLKEMSCEKTNVTFDVYRIEKKNDNIQLLEVSLDSLSSKGIRHYSNEFVVSNQLDAIFILSKPFRKVDEGKRDAIFVLVFFLWPKNHVSLEYELEILSEKMQIVNREILKK